MRFDYTHSPQLFLRIAVIDDPDCGIPDGKRTRSLKRHSVNLR